MRRDAFAALTDRRRHRALRWSRGVAIGAALLGFAILFLAPVALASEAGGHAGGHEPSLDLRAIIWKGINVVILFVGLVYILRKPVADFFRGRREQIAAELESARQARAEAAELLQRAEEEAAVESERIIQAAKDEAQRVRELAQDEIRRATDIARGELRTYAAELAVERAREMLEREIQDGDRRRLLAEYVGKLGGQVPS